MERTTLLRNVRPLVRQGLIAVRREKAGRRDELEATAKGQALLVRVYPAWRELQEQLLSELEDPRLRQTLAELGQSIAAQKAT
jgi:DNA-binding MarR family transcriptional regulator